MAKNILFGTQKNLEPALFRNRQYSFRNFSELNLNWINSKIAPSANEKRAVTNHARRNVKNVNSSQNLVVTIFLRNDILLNPILFGMCAFVVQLLLLSSSLTKNVFMVTNIWVKKKYNCLWCGFFTSPPIEYSVHVCYTAYSIQTTQRSYGTQIIR